MAYDIRVLPVEQRREIIREKTEEAKRSNQIEDFFDYTTDLKLPVIIVSADLPLYRLNNARTRSWQLSYVEEHKEGDGKVPESFFRSNDNLAAQKEQHKQLLGLAKRGVSDEPSIYSVLEEDKRQTETLLMTADGVIVNGNRRLAAMRELSDSIPAFEKVKVAVLPSHLDEKDFVEIEARLQVAPDMRLQYDWTDEALLIMSMKELRIPDDRIAKILRKKDAAAVNAIVTQFTEGKMFLRDALKEPNNYAKLVPHEQNFTELTKAIKSASPDEKDVSRLLCNNITKHAEDTSRRLYDYRVLYGLQRERALEEFAKRAKIDLSNKPNSNGASSEDDLFEDGDDAEGTASLKTRFAPVIEVLKDADRSKDNAQLLREIGDDLIDEQSYNRNRSIALNKVKRAQSLLEQVHTDDADPDTYRDMGRALEAIESEVRRISKEIGRSAVSA